MGFTGQGPRATTPRLSVLVHHMTSSVTWRVNNHLTRGIDPMLFSCWADVENGGPTLEQHRVNASCLVGTRRSPNVVVVFGQRRRRWTGTDSSIGSTSRACCTPIYHRPGRGCTFFYLFLYRRRNHDKLSYMYIEYYIYFSSSLCSKWTVNTCFSKLHITPKYISANVLN